MNILVLEDNIFRIHWFYTHFNIGNKLIVVNTAYDAISTIQSGFLPEVMFLDHDLGGKIYVPITEENSGSGFCRWFVKEGPKIYQAVIHSCNTIGASNMFDLLDKSDKVNNIQVIPFLKLMNSEVTQNE